MDSGYAIEYDLDRLDEVKSVGTATIRELPLICSLLLFPGASAQNISCSLSGTLQDPTGASLPDIGAVLIDSQTGFIWKTRTNTDGFFSFTSLTPGNFALEITAPGYRRYLETNIDVGSGERRSLGAIRLRLGEVSEAVTVTADSSHVQLATGERSSVITGNELSALATRAGDVMDAVVLLPGVVDTSNGREVASSQSMVSIYIGGGRSNQKNMTVDGITNLDSGSNNSVQTMPSWASIGEVQVLQSNYAAEYGRNSGGSITVITKSGGRQFHGLAAWSHRHEEFSANDFFNNQAGKPRSRYRYNIFDYALSGPVYIPHVLNRERSRLFFFFSQEYEEQLFDYGPKKVRVPTELERAGDFSQTFDVNGKRIAVHDPMENGLTFPGNRIPAGRFSAIVGLNILKLLWFCRSKGFDEVEQLTSGGNCIGVADGPSIVNTARRVLQVIDLAVNQVKHPVLPSRIKVFCLRKQRRNITIRPDGYLQDAMVNSGRPEETVVQIKSGDPFPVGAQRSFGDCLSTLLDRLYFNRSATVLESVLLGLDERVNICRLPAEQSTQVGNGWRKPFVSAKKAEGAAA